MSAIRDFAIKSGIGAVLIAGAIVGAAPNAHADVPGGMAPERHCTGITVCHHHELRHEMHRLEHGHIVP